MQWFFRCSAPQERPHHAKPLVPRPTSKGGNHAVSILVGRCGDRCRWRQGTRVGRSERRGTASSLVPPLRTAVLFGAVRRTGPCGGEQVPRDTAPNRVRGRMPVRRASGCEPLGGDANAGETSVKGRTPHESDHESAAPAGQESPACAGATCARSGSGHRSPLAAAHGDGSGSAKREFRGVKRVQHRRRAGAARSLRPGDPGDGSSSWPLPDCQGHQRRRPAGEYHADGQGGDAAQDPRHHDRLRAQWTEWTANAGNPYVIKMFFPEGRSLGQKTIAVDSQAKDAEFKQYPENLA
jgi:hypothetical protein